MRFDVTRNSEDLRKTYKTIKREDQRSEPVILPITPKDLHNETPESLKEVEEKASGDDSETDVLKVQIAKIDDVSTRSLRRLRSMSERAVRKVKTFVSRPIKEDTLRKFVSKVEAKIQAEKSGLTQMRGVKSGDDMFPKQKAKVSKEICETTSENVETVQKVKSDSDISLKSVAQSNKEHEIGELPSGNKLIYGNNDNDGRLIVNGEPFWRMQKKAIDLDMEDGDFEDDLQMNAEIALEVYEGKTKLVDMPAIPIILDPMNELSELKRRDEIFFSKDVLFGNSVRSMINLCDISAEPPVPSMQKNPSNIEFCEPLMCYSYQRACVAEGVRVPFFPNSNLSRSCRRLSRKNVVVPGNSNEPKINESSVCTSESEKSERLKRKSIRELIAESKKKSENLEEKSKTKQEKKGAEELRTPPCADLQIS